MNIKTKIRTKVFLLILSPLLVAQTALAEDESACQSDTSVNMAVKFAQDSTVNTAQTLNSVIYSEINNSLKLGGASILLNTAATSIIGGMGATWIGGILSMFSSSGISADDIWEMVECRVKDTVGKEIAKYDSDTIGFNFNGLMDSYKKIFDTGEYKSYSSDDAFSELKYIVNSAKIEVSSMEQSIDAWLKEGLYERKKAYQRMFYYTQFASLALRVQNFYMTLKNPLYDFDGARSAYAIYTHRLSEYKNYILSNAPQWIDMRTQEIVINIVIEGIGPNRVLHYNGKTLFNEDEKGIPYLAELKDILDYRDDYPITYTRRIANHDEVKFIAKDMITGKELASIKMVPYDSYLAGPTVDYRYTDEINEVAEEFGRTVKEKIEKLIEPYRHSILDPAKEWQTAEFPLNSATPTSNIYKIEQVGLGDKCLGISSAYYQSNGEETYYFTSKTCNDSDDMQKWIIQDKKIYPLSKPEFCLQEGDAFPLHADEFRFYPYTSELEDIPIYEAESPKASLGIEPLPEALMELQNNLPVFARCESMETNQWVYDGVSFGLNGYDTTLNFIGSFGVRHYFNQLTEDSYNFNPLGWTSLEWERSYLQTQYYTNAFVISSPELPLSNEKYFKIIPVDKNPFVIGMFFDNFHSFDGENDFHEINHFEQLNLDSEVTLAATVKVNTFGDWDGVITKGKETSPYALQLWGDGSIRFTANFKSPTGSVGEGSWNSTLKLTAGEIHNILVTYDGSRINFYIDGELDPYQPEANLVFGKNNDSLYIGANFPGGDEYFDGEIKNVRLYSYALEDWEIASLLKSMQVKGSNRLRPELNGKRVKSSDTAEVYLIDNGCKMHIANAAVYDNLFVDWQGIENIDDANKIKSCSPINDGAHLAMCENGAVYLINNGVKRHISNPQIMEDYYFNWNAIQTYDCGSMDSILDGKPVSTREL